MLTELLKQFKFFLEFDNNEVEKDNSLKDILLYTNGFIRQAYGFNIIDIEIAELRDGNGLKTLYTREGDIREIVELIVAGVAVDVNPTTTTLKFRKNKILSTINFTAGEMNIDLVYKSGYEDILDVPADLLLALFTIGRKVYYDGDLNRDGFSRIASDTKQAVGLIEAIPLLAQQTLDARKVWSIV